MFSHSLTTDNKAKNKNNKFLDYCLLSLLNLYSSLSIHTHKHTLMHTLTHAFSFIELVVFHLSTKIY